MRPRTLLIGALLAFAAAGGGSYGVSLDAQTAAKPEPAPEQALVDKYCVACHNARTLSGNLSLAGLDVSQPGDHPEIFEKVVRKVRAGLMPPESLAPSARRWTASPPASRRSSIARRRSRLIPAVVVSIE